MPMPSPATIREVSVAAGVSTATVSRVLNGVGRVDPALVAKVLRAVEETGYVPNRVGRALRKQRTDTWAVIVPDVQNTFFTSVVAELEEIAARQGFSVMLCNTDGQLERERRYIETAVALQMAGVVIAVASARESDFTQLHRAQIPVVLIDRMLGNNSQVDSVLVDNHLAGALAAKHLWSLGRRNVAAVVGPEDVTSTEQRLEGLVDTLRDLSNGDAVVSVKRTDLKLPAAEVATRALLAQENPPDAIFATNGMTTAGAYRGIQASCVRIPQDIALVGVDDEVWTRMVTPRVTVIQQPVQEIGAYAAQLLAARAKGSQESAQHVQLKPEILPRESTTVM